MAKKKSVAEEIGLKEVEIGGERVGFSDDFGKVAVLHPRELVERDHQPMYDQKVHQLEDEGYKVIYTPTEKPKKLSRRQAYDILESL